VYNCITNIIIQERTQNEPVLNVLVKIN